MQRSQSTNRYVTFDHGGTLGQEPLERSSNNPARFLPLCSYTPCSSITWRSTAALSPSKFQSRNTMWRCPKGLPPPPPLPRAPRSTELAARHMTPRRSSMRSFCRLQKGPGFPMRAGEREAKKLNSGLTYLCRDELAHDCL